jgi:hypothetical protein
MLEHLASHGTTLDPAATALFASGNETILSIFSVTQAGEDADLSQLDPSLSQSTKLTSDDIGYIPNGWVDAMNCKEKAKWLVAI